MHMARLCPRLQEPAVCRCPRHGRRWPPGPAGRSRAAGAGIGNSRRAEAGGGLTGAGCAHCAEPQRPRPAARRGMTESGPCRRGHTAGSAAIMRLARPACRGGLIVWLPTSNRSLVHCSNGHCHYIPWVTPDCCGHSWAVVSN